MADPCSKKAKQRVRGGSGGSGGVVEAIETQQKRHRSLEIGGNVERLFF